LNKRSSKIKKRSLASAKIACILQAAMDFTIMLGSGLRIYPAYSLIFSDRLRLVRSVVGFVTIVTKSIVSGMGAEVQGLRPFLMARITKR
jgi:hypothetical protein